MITEENQHLFDNNEQEQLQSELQSEQLQSELQSELQTELQSEQLQSEQLQSELETEQLQTEQESEQEIEENIIEKIDNNEKKNNNIEIRELIEKWLYLDEEIHKINEELKDLKLEKKQYEIYILEIMDNTNRQTVKSNETVIKKNIKQSKGSIKEDLIIETLTDIFKDNIKANELLQNMINKLPIKEIITLKKETQKEKKITKNKIKKKK
jgi:hypothetical protein